MAVPLMAPPAEGRQGHYAGAATRLAAFAVDVLAAWGLFSLGAAGLTFAVQLVAGRRFSLTSHQVATLVVVAVWEFFYYAYQWSLGGRTIGMALVGIRVVRSDGTPIGVRTAVLRTLAYPLSFICLGLGLVGIVVGRERRSLHDVLAGTVVVYSWDARAAHLRWLARKDGAP